MHVHLDIFAGLTPACGECQHLGQPIESGVSYCHGEMTWRGAQERVLGCVYRERPAVRQDPPKGTIVEAIEDLLSSPRHSISSEDRRWLRAELRRERAA